VIDLLKHAARVQAAARRHDALRLVADGASYAEAARAVGVDRSTVSRWARS
jgi:transposase